MKLILTLILFFATAATNATPFAEGNAQAGKKLFDDNKCNSCHLGKVGGDGSAIFTRAARIVHNPLEMVDRMHVCSGAVGLTLTKQNEQDLGAYLNQTYYKFK
jgi:cytochrome c peroxidase